MGVVGTKAQLLALTRQDRPRPRQPAALMNLKERGGGKRIGPPSRQGQRQISGRQGVSLPAQYRRRDVIIQARILSDKATNK